MRSEELLTTAQLAKRLNVASSTIRRWVRERIIPEIVVRQNVRRFDLAEVMTALRSRQKEGTRHE